MGLTDLIKKTTNGVKATSNNVEKTEKKTKKTTKKKTNNTINLDEVKTKLIEILNKYQGTDFEITQMKQEIMESFDL